MKDFRIYSEDSIRTLIKMNTVSILDSQYSNDFNNFISNEFSWFPTRIDWKASKKNYKTLDWASATRDETSSFISAVFAPFNEMAIIYASEEPGLIISKQNLYEHLKELSYWSGFKYGVHFIVGLTRNSWNIPVLNFNSFIEIDHCYMRTVIS